jgi:hypothetical protein
MAKSLWKIYEMRMGLGRASGQIHENMEEHL